jgi:hypothetical protein
MSFVDEETQLFYPEETLDKKRARFLFSQGRQSEFDLDILTPKPRVQNDLY